MVKKNPSKAVALWGIMAALTVAVSFLESLFDIPLAFPGAKVGLANAVVVTSSMISGIYGALYITLVKSLFVLVTRGAVAFILSLSGGILSSIVTVLSLKYLKKFVSVFGISILGAFMHNLGQLAAAMIIMKTTTLICYLPVLALCSLIFGATVGVVLKGIEPYINKISIKRKVENS